MRRIYTYITIPLLLSALLLFSPAVVHAQSTNQSPGVFSQILNLFKSIPEAVSVFFSRPTESISSPDNFLNDAFPTGDTVGGEFGEAINNPPIISPIQSRSVIPHVPITFQVIADDLDGDPIVYSASNLPPGAQFETTTGVFRWIPRDAHVGTTFQVTVKASDSKAIASRKVTIAVQDPSEITATNLPTGEQETVTVGGTPTQSPTRGGTNHSPVLAFIGDQNVFIGETLKLYLYATDRDQDPITYSVSRVPVGAVFNEKLGIFEWTPTTSAIARLTFGASDGTLEVSQSVSIKVTEAIAAENLAPVIADIGDPKVHIGDKLEFTISASDPEGGLVLVYKNSALPSGARFENNTFSWSPLVSQIGTYRVIFAASDGVNVVQRPATISVLAGKATSGTLSFTSSFTERTVNEGGSVSFPVVATDDSGGQIVVAATGLPLGASFTPTTSKFGSYQFSWVPGHTQSGSYSITFLATNGVDTVSNTAVIRVLNVNRTPVVSEITNKNVPENEVLSFKISVSDPDDDQITCSTVNLPQGAWFDCSTKTFSWKPAFGKAGTYLGVTFTFTDTGGLGASVGMTITVTRVNRPPQFTGIPATESMEQQLMRITLGTYASDPDNDSLTYTGTINSGPFALQPVTAIGATLDATTGVFSWIPSYTSAGKYFIDFTVSDGDAIASTSAELTIKNVNRPPVLTKVGSRNVTAGQLISITLTGSDPDGDQIVFSAPVRPAGSSFTSPTFTWIPGSAGVYSATFQASDGAPDSTCCTTEVVSITVIGSAQQPVSSIIDRARGQWASLVEAVQSLFR